MVAMARANEGKISGRGRLRRGRLLIPIRAASRTELSRLALGACYFGASAAVWPGGSIRNVKIDTFSPGLNGPGTLLLTGGILRR